MVHSRVFWSDVTWELMRAETGFVWQLVAYRPKGTIFCFDTFFVRSRRSQWTFWCLIYICGVKFVDLVAVCLFDFFSLNSCCCALTDDVIRRSRVFSEKQQKFMLLNLWNLKNHKRYQKIKSQMNSGKITERFKVKMKSVSGSMLKF